LTLKTAVNPEDEGPDTQFQRTAYSGIPSLFSHSPWLRASITHLSRNPGIVSNVSSDFSMLCLIASPKTFYTLKSP
jgi:hypothetical protein